MFSASMKHGVGRKESSPQVFAPKNRGWKIDIKLMNERPKPYNLRGYRSKSTVLGLSTRFRHNRLLMPRSQPFPDMGFSDHHPFLRDTFNTLKHVSPFQFERAWLQQEGFQDLIAEWWSQFKLGRELAIHGLVKYFS